MQEQERLLGIGLELVKAEGPGQEDGAGVAGSVGASSSAEGKDRERMWSWNLVHVFFRFFLLS